MNYRLVSAIIAVSAIVACDDTWTIEGSGILIDARREVAEFHAVRVSDGLRAEIVEGPQAVTLHLDDNIVGHVRVSVSAGVLVLEANEHDKGFEPSSGAVIRVASPTLDAIIVTDGAAAHAEVSSSEVAGECHDGARMNLTVRDAQVLRATTRDGCHAVLDGAASTLTVETSDGSDIDSELVAESADIHASDGSEVRARVTHSVRVVATDGSHVEIHGNPPARDVSSRDGSSVAFP